MCLYVHQDKCTEISTAPLFKIAQTGNITSGHQRENGFGISVRWDSNHQVKSMSYYQTKQHG